MSLGTMQGLITPFPSGPSPRDIHGLRDIQHDLAIMVDEQGEAIDDIGKDIWGGRRAGHSLRH